MFELDPTNAPVVVLNVDLRALLTGDEAIAAGLPDARHLLAFFTDYRFRRLSLDEKVEQVQMLPIGTP